MVPPIPPMVPTSIPFIIARRSSNDKKEAKAKEIIQNHVICKVFHLVFARLVTRPDNKPSEKPFAVPPPVPVGHMQLSTSSILAWAGLYPMKSKLTKQAAAVQGKSRQNSIDPNPTSDKPLVAYPRQPPPPPPPVTPNPTALPGKD